MKWTMIVTFLVMLEEVKGDTRVSCIFMEDCILPCHFKGSVVKSIVWRKVNPDVLILYLAPLHQHEFVASSFSGRISLFMDQISKGNASLELTGVTIQDQGKYHCETRTDIGYSASLITLTVEAPVSVVLIQQTGNEITCSSEGIYPKPELTWSTDHPSNLDLQKENTIQLTEQHLYNINSSLILPNTDILPVISCTVSTHRNRRKSSLRRLPSIIVSETETTIPCTASNNQSSDLIWKFNNRIILAKVGTNVSVSEEWRQHVKNVSEFGNLTLRGLSSHQEGLYSCEVSTAEDTLITSVMISLANVRGFRGGMLAALLVVAAALIGLVLICRKKKVSDSGSDATTEANALLEPLINLLGIKNTRSFRLIMVQVLLIAAIGVILALACQESGPTSGPGGSTVVAPEVIFEDVDEGASPQIVEIPSVINQSATSIPLLQLDKDPGHTVQSCCVTVLNDDCELGEIRVI